MTVDPASLSTARRERRGALAPDAELWAALREGPGLFAVLTDFYDHVYEDPRLGPFFAHVTKDWVVQKQYAFLSSILTGEKVYFGHRPRNAHHWMVISDELFDYREDLMERCLRAYGLPEPLVSRLRAIDECFRKHIVKAHAFPRKFAGLTFELEGFDSIEMGIGTLCDRCEGPIDEGAVGWYHVRTGRTHCVACYADEQDAS